MISKQTIVLIMRGLRANRPSAPPGPTRGTAEDTGLSHPRLLPHQLLVAPELSVHCTPSLLKEISQELTSQKPLMGKNPGKT